MPRVALALLLLALAGCTQAVGYAGSHPGYIKCAGKGSITGTGQTSLTAGVGLTLKRAPRSRFSIPGVSLISIVIPP